MKLVIGVTCLVALVSERGARADCDPSPRPAQVEVYSCKAVETKGDLIDGTVTWADGKMDDAKLWLPASEKLDCLKLPETTQLTAQVVRLCCGAASDAACTAGAELSMTKVVMPKPVKKATRPQLESEVEKLRAENGRLRAELHRFRLQFHDQIEQLQQEQRKLGSKLKD